MNEWMNETSIISKEMYASEKDYFSNQKKSVEKLRRQYKKSCMWRKGTASPTREGAEAEGCLRHKYYLEIGLGRQWCTEKKQQNWGEKRRNQHCKKPNQWPTCEMRGSPRMQNKKKIYKEIRYNNIKYKTSFRSQRRALGASRNDTSRFRPNE